MADQRLWWKQCSTLLYRRPPFLIACCRDPRQCMYSIKNHRQHAIRFLAAKIMQTYRYIWKYICNII
jgi:hypothetical protein